MKKYRINVAGSTQILSENALFCEKLGAELVSEKDIVLISGGFKYFKEYPDLPSADWSFIRGALAHMKFTNTDPVEQIETFLPDPGKDPSKIVRFHEGKIIVLEFRGHNT
jgi:hypothetical protein